MDTLLNSPAPFVSIGGLAIGLGILIYYLAPWWWKGRKKTGGKGKKGDAPAETSSKRDWRDLTPLAAGLTLGSLAAACTGGILGWAAHWISRANESVGNTAVAGTTGTEAEEVQQEALPVLNGGAAILTALLLVALVALWRKIPTATRQQLAAGGWAGASLALSAGAAGILARAIVPAVNSAGDAFAGAL